jgi:hypothetical protein
MGNSSPVASTGMQTVQAAVYPRKSIGFSIAVIAVCAYRKYRAE